MKGSGLANGADTRAHGAEARSAQAGPARSAQGAQSRSREHEGLTRDELLAAYRLMLLSRKIDDKEILLKNQQKAFFQISGAGHEAVLVAAGLQLRAGEDWLFPYYRDRALCLTIGVTPLEMFLASVGSVDDPANAGRQMPSHWGHRRFNMPSKSSCVGTQCLHAVGCAEAGLIYSRVTAIDDRETRYRSDEVTYVSIGEGGTSEGEFWESLSTVCVRKLPVVYLVEDNGYAISVPVDVQTPGGDISRVVDGYPGLRVFRCDGTDFIASYRTMREAVTHARERNGPVLVHATVTRPYSHSFSDDERLYKTPGEREAETRRDPLRRMQQFLKTEGLATDQDLADLLASVDREVNQAADEALRAPKPDPATASHFVFSPDTDPSSADFATEPQPHGKPDTMVAAINATLKDEMARNPRIVIFGQDVADVSNTEALPLVTGKGGVFKVTHGLQRLYGDTRVFNSPLAEANIVGRAVGMALRGLKPVVEIQFFDYIWPAFMQIRDELSMMRYRSGNHWSCPVVIRVPIGGYLRGGAPYHSQSAVAIFAHTPGLRIVLPSNAQDAAGLLRTAIRCDDPVLFCEHKHLYRQTYNKGAYPGPDYMIPFGKAAVPRDGTDIVVFTWGALVQRSLLAAQQAERQGISVAVVDLRTIIPYDWETIAAYTKKTSRAIVAHEDQLTAGFGAEIAARISQDLFDYLDAPVTRVASLDCPVAYAPDLEDAILPGSADVLKAIKSLAAYYSWIIPVFIVLATRPDAALRVEVLRSAGGLPPHIVGTYEDAINFQQDANGTYFVFDRRGHTVHTVDTGKTTTRKILEIGQEDGRVIQPTGFDLASDGRFVVADVPRAQQRVQTFDPAGKLLSGFFLPGAPAARVIFGNLMLNGAGSVQHAGETLLISHPEGGALFTEYSRGGFAQRSIGRLRATGFEDDRDVHIAMNAGLPLVDPTGGFYYVFITGRPLVRKYSAAGTLVFERHIEGSEIDVLLQGQPTRWPRRRVQDREVPLVTPVVRAARVSPAGELWVSLTVPYTYVYNTDGDKIRTVQFSAAGIISPTSLFFTRGGQLLVTPGCYEFDPR